MDRNMSPQRIWPQRRSPEETRYKRPSPRHQVRKPRSSWLASKRISFQATTKEAATRPTLTRSWPVSNPNNAHGSANSGKKSVASIPTCPTRDRTTLKFSRMSPKVRERQIPPAVLPASRHKRATVLFKMLRRPTDRKSRWLPLQRCL